MMNRLLSSVLAVLSALLVVLPATAQTSQAVAISPDYRIGPGDVIRITVFQNPDLSLETHVSESGYVSYPLLGRIKIGGLAARQAEKRIADGLRNGSFVKQPQVSISVAQVRGNLVSVLGQINRPGRYPIDKSDLLLSAVLANAGGIAGSGADTVTLVGTRRNRPYRLEIDLPTVFASGGRVNDVVVKNGDVIWVDRAPLIYIYGEVQRPGAMRLERNMTVMQALAAGGGLNQRGTEKGLRIHRKAANDKLQVVRPAMDDKLRPGDIVYVRESLF